MKPDVSALMDGELDQAASQSLLSRLRHDEELQHCWSMYHQIGDVMRREHRPDESLQQKIMASLADEPTVLAPPKAQPSLAPKFAMAIAASLATVGVVSWVGFQSAPASVPVTLAQKPVAPKTEAPALEASIAVPVVTAPATAPVVASLLAQPAGNLPAANVQDYLFAHHELSPASGVMQVSLGAKR